MCFKRFQKKTHLVIKLNGRKTDTLRFADDTAVVAENEEDPQSMLRTMEETLLDELNIKINEKSSCTRQEQ